MITERRNAILYIAQSLDGYIAGDNDNLDFLSVVEMEGEDYGYGEFMKKVDTVIMGRKTYTWIINHLPEFVHPDKMTYVITRTAKTNSANLIFYRDDLKVLISDLKSKPGQDIFIEGGAEIVHELLKFRLIDEFYIAVIPILVGGGVKLFTDGRPVQKLSLVDSKTYDSGLIMLHYKAISE